MAPPLIPPGYLDAVAFGVAFGGGLIVWLMFDSMPSSAPFGGVEPEFRVVLAGGIAMSTYTTIYTYPIAATVYVVIGLIVFVLGMAFVLVFTTDLLLIEGI